MRDRWWRISGGDLPNKPDSLHGRGDGTNSEDLSKCYNCGYETHKLQSPKGGTTLQFCQWSRRVGLGLVICGAVMCGIMGFLVLEMGSTLLNPGVSSGGTRFPGTAAKARMILGIFEAVLLALLALVL